MADTPRVTVPVEPTPKMLAATWDHEIDQKGGVESHNTRNARIWSAMLSAAPAPEGEAVSPLARRLAYGYAIMHQAICHMAGTSGASGRWYYDKASEAFGRVSPIHAITETSNPPINGDYFSGLSDFLDALAAREEAPAEAGERSGGQIAFDAWNGGDGDPYWFLESDAWRQRWERVAVALRAQPPAREDAQPVWVDGVPTKHQAKEWFIAETTFGERVVLTALPEEYAYDFKTADETYIKADCIKRWMPFPDSQYRFPCPAPDALRVAVEAFGVITDLSVNLRQGGPDSSDLNDLSDALNTAVDVAHEALAALQAEQGAK